ncbi:AD domain-containing protein [Caerostris extrusa]|uniref:AD domain-containing protein n=1 Tax=Caerostris extrusa TaxID=172846 RepID=A0AAV4SEG5_CAEEX|nr:AD domain-containing protein [Caerostris extrusa]
MDTDFSVTLKHKDHLLKYVKIKTEGTTYEGWLKCVDPLTGNLILVLENLKETVLIMSKAIISLEVIKEANENVKNVIQHEEKCPEEFEDNLCERKKRLISWIKANRLPFEEVEESDEIIICDTITVKPPYTAESCTGTIGRVLLMIQKLVSNIPKCA